MRMRLGPIPWSVPLPVPRWDLDGASPPRVSATLAAAAAEPSMAVGCGSGEWRGLGEEGRKPVQCSCCRRLRGDFRRKEGGKRCRRHVASSSCLARAFSMTTRTSPPSGCRSLRLFLFVILVGYSPCVATGV
jgi:hypothetical protein